MLDLITPVNDVFRRDLTLDDDALVDPTQPDAVEQGEWLVRDAAGKLVRVAASVPGAMQVFSQKGDFATQALGKLTVLQLHEYEAETDMFDPALAGGVAIGTELSVDSIPLDTINRGVLKVALAGEFVVGIVTKGPEINGGKLRFTRVSPYQKNP